VTATEHWLELQSSCSVALMSLNIEMAPCVSKEWCELHSSFMTCLCVVTVTVNCSGCAQPYLGDAFAGVHLSYTIKQACPQLVKGSNVTALDCLSRHHVLLDMLVTYVYICIVS